MLQKFLRMLLNPEVQAMLLKEPEERQIRIRERLTSATENRKLEERREVEVGVCWTQEVMPGSFKQLLLECPMHLWRKTFVLSEQEIC